MVRRNLKRVLIGTTLICLAFVMAFFTIDFVKSRPKLVNTLKSYADKLEGNSPIDNISLKNNHKDSKLIDQEKRDVESQKNSEKMSLETLVAKSKEHYDEKEQNRKEGFLWIDRKSNKLVATLGAVNGVLPGSKLSVYKREKKVGEVEVDMSFDVISYCHPLDMSFDNSNTSYYRVLVE